MRRLHRSTTAFRRRRRRCSTTPISWKPCSGRIGSCSGTKRTTSFRTVWLDGREPPPNEFSVQGFSVGRYEGGALIVETTHFVFDITGFDDYNGIPSSQLKKVTERYWRDGEELRMTLTVEDPLFLREPASYTTRWLPAPEDYKLNAYACDAEERVER